MVYRINTYSLSFRALDSLTQTSSRLEKSLEKLSSGLRINSAADDPTGLGIAERLRLQARGLYQAKMNSQNGVSLLQAADTAMESIHSLLQTMRERAVEALDGTLSAEDRLELQSEINRLRDGLNQIAWNTEFNTMRLLDGSRNGIVSSSSPGVEGILTGIPRASGQYLVSIALVTPGASMLQQTQAFTNRTTGDLATEDTQLQSLAQFYDGGGGFLLAIPATLTVSSQGNTASFQINGATTLHDLAGSLQDAMQELGLSDSRVQVISTAMTGLSGVGGYLELVSGKTGEAGEFTVVADPDIAASLGLTTVRDAANPLVQLTLEDQYGNLSTVRTSSGRATGLLDGVDLAFSSQAAQVAGTRGLTTGLNLTAMTFGVTGDSATANVTLAGGFWTLEGLARAINDQTTAITGLTTTVSGNELRISYSASFTISGATAGNTLGLVDGANPTSLTTDHLTAAETLGFSRYLASSTTNVLAGSTAVYTLFDGANQVDITAFNTLGSGSVTTPDMVVFSAFQALAATELANANVNIRLDQVGNSFAFTSRQVGTAQSAGADVPSYVRLTVTGTDTDLQVPLQHQFGLYAGSDSGTGDQSFALSVVRINSLFQIGPQAGQTVHLDIGNLSTLGLGLQGLDVTSIEGANRALSRIDQAIDQVSSERGKVGTLQNLLESTATSLTEKHTNALDAEARIRDVDMAAEIIEFTRQSLFLESGTAVLAQANLFPGNVMKLLDND